MKFGEPLGVHGVVLSSENPRDDARKWARALRLPLLSRTRREVVLGLGPELFLAFARPPRGKSGEAARPVEIHFAVRGLREPGRRPDALGGDSVVRVFGAGRLVVREFRRPPSGKWKRPRAPAPSPPRSRKRARSGAG